MNIHSEQYTTRWHELGVDHLLRVQCVCNYMEEAAGKHADALGVGLARLGQDDLAWVLVKMRLCLCRRPGPDEAVRVDTWPVAVERAQFRRDFILYDNAENVLATAVTQWVVMGTKSRRMERLPGYVAALEPHNPPLAQQDGDIRIPALPGEALAGPVFPVRLADIDQNQHVNNGRYVDFSLEAADVFQEGQGGAASDLARLDIIFRAEALRGDVICTYTQAEPETPGALVHSMRRRSDGAELARSRTVYTLR